VRRFRYRGADDPNSLLGGHGAPYFNRIEGYLVNYHLQRSRKIMPKQSVADEDVVAFAGSHLIAARSEQRMTTSNHDGRSYVVEYQSITSHGSEKSSHRALSLDSKPGAPLY